MSLLGALIVVRVGRTWYSGGDKFASVPAVAALLLDEHLLRRALFLIAVGGLGFVALLVIRSSERLIGKIVRAVSMVQRFALSSMVQRFALSFTFVWVFFSCLCRTVGESTHTVFAAGHLCMPVLHLHQHVCAAAAAAAVRPPSVHWCQ